LTAADKTRGSMGGLCANNAARAMRFWTGKKTCKSAEKE
jgi:hypothetical protein